MATTETNRKSEVPGDATSPFDIVANRMTLARHARALEDAEREEAIRAANPALAKADEGYESPELLAVARSPRGARRSGVTVGAEKTTIPAGTFKNKAAFDAFVNDPRILAVETTGPAKKLKDGANDLAPADGLPLRSLGETALGGSMENATPEMLAAAEEGILKGHPSIGAGVPIGRAAVAPQVNTNAAAAAEIEKVKADRDARAKKSETDK